MRRVLQDVLRRVQLGQHAGKGTTSRTRRKRPHYSYYHGTDRRTTALDVARFGLLGVFALPFSVWIARFSYDYVYRVDLCASALEQADEDEEATAATHAGRIFGREKELAEARALLDKDPDQIVVVAGMNEAGKSRFVAELLRRRKNVTSIQLAQLVDSVSSLTEVFVDGFGLRWLKMRHALVDVLPFAGSEILVMKERYSNRDFEQALRVVTEALKKMEASRRPTDPKPVIVIDDLGEGDSEWMRSREGELSLQRLLQWCVYVTKERHLAHVILTGNEELVRESITGNNRKTRGHMKVIGLSPLEPKEAASFVVQEWPDASPKEVARLTGTFGGWIHDLRLAAREVQSKLARDEGTKRSAVLDKVIQARLQQRVERVTTAFAKAEEGEDSDSELGGDGSSDADDDDMDPYLDPLKSIYSEQANQPSGLSSEDAVSWTPLQLWHTLHKIADSTDMTVPFASLRDDVFDGDSKPILGLMKDDVLGFRVGQSTDGGAAWYVTPASPVVGRAFLLLLAHGDLRERFNEMVQDIETRDKIKEIEVEIARLKRQNANRERRKASLLSTVELGQVLDREDRARHKLTPIYDDIVTEEAADEAHYRVLRRKLDQLRGAHTSDESIQSDQTSSLQKQLKSAMFSVLAREDPSLSRLQEGDRLGRLEAAFHALDTSNCGELSIDDVGRLITSVTGDEVDLDAVRSLMKTWDLDNNGRLDYNEFLRMIGMSPEEPPTREGNTNKE